MQAASVNIAGKIRYLPLDLLVACASFEDQVLAQYMLHKGEAGITLLATDLQRSVLNTLDARRQLNPIV